jgi:hypothetical protein
MIRRSTLIVVILFVLVAGFWIYLQKKPASISSQSTQATSTPEPSLLNLSAVSVTAFKLVDSQGQVAIRVGADGQWTVEQPANSTITAGNIQEILSQLVGISVMFSFSSAPPEEGTGLGKPAYTLTISSTTGPERVIKVGNATPTDSGYYVQVDQALPVVISKSAIDRVAELLRSTRPTPTPLPSATVTPSQDSTGQPPTPTPTPVP